MDNQVFPTPDGTSEPYEPVVTGDVPVDQIEDAPDSRFDDLNAKVDALTESIEQRITEIEEGVRSFVDTVTSLVLETAQDTEPLPVDGLDELRADETEDPASQGGAGSENIDPELYAEMKAKGLR